MEPILSLSFTIHSNKGVYVPLLGSGLSRAAGIPTGWEIVEDLIKKLAHLKGATVEPSPAEWYQNTFGEEPGYSNLLDAIAKSSAERNQILRCYFEATETEREQGLKVPTAAHKAIAELVVSGHIRVIITTNFDRLMEVALESIGIVPTVIDSPEKIEGAMPLRHSACTVIKLHGDYLDIRFKNTPSELEQYDDRLNRLLDQIFDEYGLIVCGWSADYDRALEAAIARCPSRRFTTYWAARDSVGEVAQKLIALRRAEKIKIRDADAFFRELSEKVAALETLARSHPLSVKVAVATAKKYLSEDRYVIQLHDLVMDETTKVLNEMSGEHLSTAANFSPDELRSRVRRYEAITEILLALVSTGCYWSRPPHADLWSKCLGRVANSSRSYSGTTAWLPLRWYPALLLLYGGGIASVASEKYDILNAVLVKSKVWNFNMNREEPLALAVHPVKVIDTSISGYLPDMENKYTPLNDHLFDVLRDPLKDILPQESEYERCFDRFEYLLALVHADLYEKGTGRGRFWGPMGRFLWKDQYERESSELSALKQEAEGKGEDWQPLKAGLFSSSNERFMMVANGFDQILRQRNG